MNSFKQHAKVAYAAYRKEIARAGEHCVVWDALLEREQAAWIASSKQLLDFASKRRSNPFKTIELVPDPTMVVRKIRRVRGGFMNRWWIRVEIVEPNPNARIRDGRLHAHPSVMNRIKQELLA